MAYKILADFTLLVHLFWILFLIFGACLGRRNRIFRWIHLLGFVFAIVAQIFGWICPLTYLEVWLRSNHEPSLAYRGSFIIHYVEKLVYLQLSRPLLVTLTLLLFAFNGWLYLKPLRWGQRAGDLLKRWGSY